MVFKLLFDRLLKAWAQPPAWVKKAFSSVAISMKYGLALLIGPIFTA